MILYHLWLCPHARKIRVILAEKGVEAELRVEQVWEPRDEFLALNPAGEVPALVLDDGTALADSVAIADYLDETHPEPPLIGTDPVARAEARRLAQWFDIKFQREVTVHLVDEKMHKRLFGRGDVDSAVIRAGAHNVHGHLDYIGWLMERRNWLAGSHFSIADIAAAAQLSCVDYLGDVPWEDHGPAKLWYARVKSRPSFRAILADHIPGAPPPRHYADLDF